MALIQINADFTKLIAVLERVAKALEATVPPPLTYDFTVLTEEEREQLGFTQRNDREAWKAEVQARIDAGDTDPDAVWRAYAPRS